MATRLLNAIGATDTPVGRASKNMIPATWAGGTNTCASTVKYWRARQTNLWTLRGSIRIPSMDVQFAVVYFRITATWWNAGTVAVLVGTLRLKYCPISV